jgi:hypothetical protein
MTKHTLAAIVSGELEFPSPRADGLIAVDGDAAAARGLLDVLARSA